VSQIGGEELNPGQGELPLLLLFHGDEGLRVLLIGGVRQVKIHVGRLWIELGGFVEMNKGGIEMTSND